MERRDSNSYVATQRGGVVPSESGFDRAGYGSAKAVTENHARRKTEHRKKNRWKADNFMVLDRIEVTVVMWRFEILRMQGKRIKNGQRTLQIRI